MVSAIAFVGLVAAVAAQRLWELCVSGRNEAALRARGAIEHAPEQMSWMRLVHAGWLLAAPLEVWALERVATPWVAAAALALFALGQGLRYAAMRAPRRALVRARHDAAGRGADRRRRLPLDPPPELPRGDPRDRGAAARARRVDHLDHLQRGERRAALAAHRRRGGGPRGRERLPRSPRRSPAALAAPDGG
ncbi:MAG: hypothetical protein M5U28_27370 [Sandaracinaceae bacterium]|nr:hypothetical protein [Sandaracinaceae bacterium]